MPQGWEDTLWTGAGSSWRVERRGPVVHLPVLPVVATGASTEEKWKLRQFVSALHLLQMRLRDTIAKIKIYILGISIIYLYITWS